MYRLILAGAVVWSVAARTPAAAQATPAYDLVLLGGRVIDPESGLDAVRNIGVRSGRIAAVTTSRIVGRDTVDVKGLVVAPGFIEIHAHTPDSASYRSFAYDGVTTVLDLEAGVFPVARWYADRARGELVNFGAAAGHRDMRIALLQGDAALRDPATLADTAAAWARQSLDASQLAALLRMTQASLEEGGVGVGMVLQVVPATSHEEVLRVMQLAATSGAVTHVHLRYQGDLEPASSLAALQEILADVALTGGSAHIVHVTSIGLRQTPLLLETIDRARTRGLDVTTELYPYEAINQRLASAMFDAGWQQRLGISFGDILWPPTGERLTAESFARYRASGGTQPAVIFAIPDSVVTLALAHSGVIVASDASSVRTHPRSTGTRGRVLGHYVREKKALSLADAIGRMTLLPARRLEKSVPQMRAKGRIKVGADADITVFDAARVIDRATFADPQRYSDGFVHVLVGGTFVLRNGVLIEGVRPGRAIRRTPSTPARSRSK
jgi:N-acyl-D-aspartate/D-glutamate deacylase